MVKTLSLICKNNISYKQVNVGKKCKETHKKRKTSPRKKSPRRNRMKPQKPTDKITMYKTWEGRTSHEKQDPTFFRNTT